jgi:hypothetical protein
MNALAWSNLEGVWVCTGDFNAARVGKESNGDGWANGLLIYKSLLLHYLSPKNVSKKTPCH